MDKHCDTLNFLKVDLTNRDSAHDGFRGTCASCPANEGMNAEGTLAQAYGCLPTLGEIIAMQREEGKNWACHEDDSKVCAGLCHHAKAYELDLSSGKLHREYGVHKHAEVPPEFAHLRPLD